MDRPGSFDLRHVRKLLENRFFKIVPDKTFISGSQPTKGENRFAASGSTDNSFALVYLAKGQSVKIVMSKMENDFKACWFNPRNGFEKKIGVFRNNGIKEFTPPSSGLGNDWMLVLETL